MGGGANKGDYMEDYLEVEDSTVDVEGENSDTQADTPGKLKKKVKNSKELNEVN